MRPFFIIFNASLPGGDRAAFLHYEPDAVLPVDQWGYRPTHEQATLIDSAVPGYQPDRCGVYKTRAAARDALREVARVAPDFTPRIIQIGKAERNLSNKPVSYDVEYTNPNGPGALTGTWEAGFKTRAAARAARDAAIEFEKNTVAPDNYKRWNFRVVPVYA